MGNTDLYLRALALRHKFAEEPIREAVALLEQALALSPADAPAAAMIAWLWVHQVGVWHAVSDAEITEALLLAGSEVFADCCRREGAGRGSGRLRGRRVRSIFRSPVWEHGVSCHRLSRRASGIRGANGTKSGITADAWLWLIKRSTGSALIRYGVMDDWGTAPKRLRETQRRNEWT